MKKAVTDYMREIGRKGGSQTSDKKRASSRENAKKALAARLKGVSLNDRVKRSV